MFLPRFLRHTRGSVAPLFALALIPILGAIGAAVDYSKANSARTAMQAAIDATALAVSKDAATLTQAELQSKASSYFAAVFNRTEVQGPAVTATYTSGKGGSQVVVAGSGYLITSFLGVIGINKIDIGSSSTVKWGSSRLRVALVLDNTGSMASSGKMDALKTATKNLLTQLKTAAKQDGDVYVSIVPYSKDVNVGKANVAATWLDWSDWDAANGSYSPCTQYNWKGKCIAGTWKPNDHATWNGCVTDRDQDYDVANTTPVTSNPSTLFPTEQYGACPTALMPLSYDWTALNAKVDAMTPTGNTNNTIGLAWGWQALTQGAPLDAPAEDATYPYQKVVVMLTDGLNTQNRWGSSQAAIDKRTEKVCANMKAAGVTIFTVLVMEGNATLLKNCASDAGKYFPLTSAGEIVTAFEQIGTSLSKLRIAQ